MLRTAILLLSLSAFGVAWGQATPPRSDADSRTESHQYMHLMQRVTEECAPLSTPEATKCLQSPRVWWQHGLASVVVGLDPKGFRVGQKIYIGVAGPGPYLGRDDKGRLRIASIYESQSKLLEEMVVDELTRMIDSTVARPSDLIHKELRADPSLANSAAKTDQYIANQMATIFDAQSSRFHAILDPILRNRGVPEGDFDLVLFETPCFESLGCRMEGDRQGPQSAAFHRFSKLRALLRSSGPSNLGKPFRIRDGRQGAAMKIEAFSELRPGAHPWPKARTAANIDSGFQRLVQDRRHSGGAISSSVTEVLSLSARTTLAVADLHDSPAQAAFLSKLDGRVVVVSDEFARTRLLECQRLRGALSTAEVQNCSGYIVDAPTLAGCAARGVCYPTPISGTSATMVADLLFITSLDSTSKLASENLFPRRTIGKDSSALPAMEACLNSTGPDYVAWVQCTTRRTTNEAGRATMDCVQRAGTNKNAIASCATQSLDSTNRAQVECLRTNAANPSALVLCTSGSMPKQAETFLRCTSALGKSTTENALIANCLGKDATFAKRCVDRVRMGDWAGALECGTQGQALPKEVAAMAKCMRQSGSQDPANVGVCLIGETAGGDVGKAMRCAVEAGYDAWSTALCMASNNLTADQRILLQCAMQSGGEPTTTATCTMGKLAMKELANCKGKKFAEDKCFGENNEFRKFARTLGAEIGPKSVVADIINVQLRVLEISGVSPILTETEKYISKQIGEVVSSEKAILDELAKGNIGGAVESHLRSTCSRMSFGIVKC